MDALLAQIARYFSFVAWFFKDAELLQVVLGESRMETFHPYNSLFKAEDAGKVKEMLGK